jgi:hypothetical protein
MESATSYDIVENNYFPTFESSYECTDEVERETGGETSGGEDILSLYGVATRAETNWDLTDQLSDVAIPLIQRPALSWKQAALKVTPWAGASMCFLSSTAIASIWAGKKEVLEFAMIANGASIMSLCKLGLDSEFFKLFSKKLSDWSYESFFLDSMYYRNEVPQQFKPYIGSNFFWIYGFMGSKDIYTFLSLTQADLRLSSIPAEEKDSLQMIGFKTQDKKRHLFHLACLISGIAVTIWSFGWLTEKYSQMGDFGKLGIPQDIIALFTFAAFAKLLTGLFCDTKRVMQKNYVEQLKLSTAQPQPYSLKFCHVITRIFLIFSSALAGIALAIKVKPNTVGAYFKMGAASSLVFSQEFLTAEEFENPESRLHDVEEIAKENDPQLPSFKDKIVSIIKGKAKNNIQNAKLLYSVEKIVDWVEKYGATILFEIAFLTFWIHVLAHNPYKDWSAVWGVLTSYHISLLSTLFLAPRYHPHKEKYLQNTLAFYWLYFPLFRSFIFQYITTVLEIDNQNLDPNHFGLYLLRSFAYVPLGDFMGTSRAISILDKQYHLLPVNPSIFSQEINKFVIRSLGYGD